MSNKCSETNNSNSSNNEISPSNHTKAEQASSKLERRRFIEDLFEERRLQEELGDFDML